MKHLDTGLVLLALEETGSRIAGAGPASSVRLIIAGGAAGLLAKLLAPTRTTGDCDVMWASGERAWERVRAAAAAAGASLGLPENWLNKDCAMYAWCLPLGWLERCERVGVFGLLEVDRLSRIDLIATKVVGSPARPHDYEDLLAMAPTAAELTFVDEHLDRLAAEHLGGETFEDQRAIVEALRIKR